MRRVDEGCGGNYMDSRPVRMDARARERMRERLRRSRERLTAWEQREPWRG